MFTDEWNLKVFGLDEQEKVLWARALRKWFPPVASSHIYSCCCLVDKSSGLCNPVDCGPPASSVHGVSQASILEWVDFSFPRASSRPRDQPESPALAGRFSTTEPCGNSHCITILDLINCIL